MVIKVVINGFGCIGRFVFCLMVDNLVFDVVVINDLIDIEIFVYFLKYDIV